MTATPKESIFEALAGKLRARSALDEQIAALEKMLKDAKRLELKQSSKSLPYLDGRISTHAWNILKERGATPRSELIAILESGGAGATHKNAVKEIDKALNRFIDVGKIVETPHGLDIGHPTKPVRKSALFSKKKK